MSEQSVLRRLTSKQIKDRWKDIRALLDVSLPPSTTSSDKNMMRVLESLLEGSLQCWMVLNGEKPVGMLITSIIIEAGTLERNLLIYSFNSIGISDELLFTGFSELCKVAREAKCVNLQAYTENDRIVELVQQLGGTASVKFLSVPIKKEV